MPLTRVYPSDQSDDVLLNAGPAINVIEVATANAKNARGRGILGLVGAVVNDKGLVNQALVLENGIDDLFGQYGGFKSWLGDGLGAGLAGATSGYVGNLAAHCWNLSAPAVRLVIPDLAIKDATYATGTDLLVRFTRSDAANGQVTIPAGHRISDGSTYILATLEDVTYGAAETGAKTVRCRQVSDSSVSPVALNTVTTFVDATPDANITINTADTTVPDLMDAAEVELRYEAAFNAINDTLPGQQITEIACDRTEATLLDSLSDHAATSTSNGFWRRAYVGPPIGTTAADARTGGSDSADRAALDQARAMYSHPHWRRSFGLDSANLTGPAYMATFAASGIIDAACVAQVKPEQNPAGDPAVRKVLKTWGASALESISGGSPDLATHWGANISQHIFERGTDGTISATFHDCQMADGTKVADRRMRDYLQEALILVVRPYHKLVATPSNRTGAINAVIAKLDELKSEADPSRARIGSFQVTSIWTPATNHLRIKCVIALLGNMDVITLHVDAQTSNGDVIVEEVA